MRSRKARAQCRRGPKKRRPRDHPRPGCSVRAPDAVSLAIVGRSYVTRGGRKSRSKSRRPRSVSDETIAGRTRGGRPRGADGTTSRTERAIRGGSRDPPWAVRSARIAPSAAAACESRPRRRPAGASAAGPAAERERSEVAVEPGRVPAPAGSRRMRAPRGRPPRMLAKPVPPGCAGSRCPGRAQLLSSYHS